MVDAMNSLSEADKVRVPIAWSVPLQEEDVENEEDDDVLIDDEHDVEMLLDEDALSATILLVLDDDDVTAAAVLDEDVELEDVLDDEEDDVEEDDDDVLLLEEESERLDDDDDSELTSTWLLELDEDVDDDDVLLELLLLDKDCVEPDDEIVVSVVSSADVLEVLELEDCVVDDVDEVLIVCEDELTEVVVFVCEDELLLRLDCDDADSVWLEVEIVLLLLDELSCWPSMAPKVPLSQEVPIKASFVGTKPAFTHVTSAAIVYAGSQSASFRFRSSISAFANVPAPPSDASHVAMARVLSTNFGSTPSTSFAPRGAETHSPS
jgi:hypothetical protein